MIVEYIRYALTAHTPGELIAAYDVAARHLDAAPECIDYELSRCVDEPASMILRIRWRSAEAHMSGFRAGSNFPPFLTAIRHFIAELAEMRHYEATSVRSDAQGSAAEHI